jgi:hypothetical protein
MDFEKLKKRVIGIITEPMHEWRVVESERDDIASVYRNYIVPLAAIPAIALFIGMGIVGVPFVGRFGIITALSSAIFVYLTNLVSPLIAAVVIEKLAPKFKSSGTFVEALKLVAYASTPMWLASVLYVFLYLSPLVLAGAVYAIYLFYLGLPAMMKTPPDNVVPYMVVSAIVLLLVNMLLALLRTLLGMPSYGF